LALYGIATAAFTWIPPPSVFWRNGEGIANQSQANTKGKRDTFENFHENKLDITI